MQRILAVLAAAALAALGCSSSESEPGPVASCPEEATIGGLCAGVPAAALCAEDVCSAAGCTSLSAVSNDAELSAALASAGPGACVALRPGAYSSAIVPAGVQLLGKSADLVSVGSVTLLAGTGAAVRGLSVTEDGISLEGTTDVQIDAVRVRDASGDGIHLEAGASVTITASDIDGSARYAVSAFDVSSVTIEQSILTGAKGPGLWAQCSGGCDCAGSVAVAVSNTIIRDTKKVGVSLVGVNATFANVDIKDNTVGSDFQPGGGLAVSGCSVLDAAGLRVLNNSDFGILVDDASATLRPSDAGVSTEVAGNLRGIWAQRIGHTGPEQVALEGASVTDNSGIGFGIDQSSMSVSISNSVIRNTSLLALPVLVGGANAGVQQVGDGLNWLGGSELTIDGLTISGSARQSVLIDGEVAAGSSIGSVTLEGADLTLGILQQNLPQGGIQPTTTGTTPTIRTSSAQDLPVPKGLAIPPGM